MFLDRFLLVVVFADVCIVRIGFSPYIDSLLRCCYIHSLLRCCFLKYLFLFDESIDIRLEMAAGI